MMNIFHTIDHFIVNDFNVRVDFPTVQTEGVITDEERKKIAKCSRAVRFVVE